MFKKSMISALTVALIATSSTDNSTTSAIAVAGASGVSEVAAAAMPSAQKPLRVAWFGNRRVEIFGFKG